MQAGQDAASSEHMGQHHDYGSRGMLIMSWFKVKLVLGLLKLGFNGGLGAHVSRVSWYDLQGGWGGGGVNLSAALHISFTWLHLACVTPAATLVLPMSSCSALQ